MFKKTITSDELTKQINPKNAKLISQFLKEKDRKCSDQTVKGYACDLNLFFTWNLLYNENKYFPEIKKIELSDFFNFSISDLKWESSRFSRVRSCLSGISDFYIKYYADDEMPNYRNFVNSTIESLPKNFARKKTVLSEEQVNSLLKYLVEDLESPQEALLLATAISSGMRISEIEQMTIDLIDENNTAFDDLFLETTEEIRTKGFGKVGHRITKFFIKDMFLPYYKAWIPIREQTLKDKGLEHNYLFIKRDGEPADKQNFRVWMKKWEKFLETDLYFHAFRHFYTTHLSRIGLTNDFIVETMGWLSGEQMVKIYNDLTAKDKKWKDTIKLSEYLKQRQSEIDSEDSEID